MPTRFPFFGWVLVEMEDGLTGLLPRKIWHNWANSSKEVDTISMVLVHPPSYWMHIWAAKTSQSALARFDMLVVREIW